MKIIFSLIATVAVIAIGFFLTSQRDPIPTGQVSPSPLSSGEYRLIVLTDAVTLKRSGEATGSKVRGIVTVAKGDQIATSLTGRARLSWPNGTVTTLEEDSLVIVAELADDGAKTRLDLIFGDIWSKVSRILGSGQYYEVRTQDTVAAVRGTVFRTTWRDGSSRVQGIERVVRVLARRTDGAVDDSTGVDVGEQMEVVLEHTAKIRQFAAPRRITAEGLRDRVMERIKREKDLNDEQVQRLTPLPLLTPSATPRPAPSLTPSPTPTPTTIPTIISTPTLTPVPTPTPVVSLTSTPFPPVTLDHVFPGTVSQGQTFSLEGANFSSGRNVSRITAVTVGGKLAVDFAVIMGGTDIFVTPPQLSAGVHDISVTTTDGDTVTLKNAVTIQ